MNKTNNVNKTFKLPLLGGVLALQVVFAALLFWQNNQQTVITREPLLSVSESNIKEVALTGDDGEIRLYKKGDTWLAGNDLPVEQSRVTQMLEKLTALKSGWPLATSVSAQERFEVSDQKFQRKIRITSNNGDAQSNTHTLYLGSSVSFKEVHVRAEESSDIFAGTFNIYDAPTNLNAWLDTELLQPKGEVMALQAGAFSVEKTNGQWPSENTPEDSSAADATVASTDEPSATDAAVESSDGAAATTEKEAEFSAQTYVNALNNLRVLGVAENLADLDAVEVNGTATENGAVDASEKTLQKFVLKITTSEGKHQYELLANKEQYYIRRDDFNATFKLAKSQYEALVELAQQKA